MTSEDIKHQLIIITSDYTGNFCGYLLKQRYYSVVSLVEVLFYVHKNRRFIRDGEPRTSTSTFTQLLSSVVI